VICAGYRSPGLVAKVMTTLDAMSGGRIDIGVGAGWNGGEYTAFGYRFPSLRERMEAFAEFLTIIRALTSATAETIDYVGEFHSIHLPVILPRTLQTPAMPLIVGGNGPNSTWRLAARFADELNLDQQLPDGVAAMLPSVAARCEEIGRDPASLRISVNVPEEAVKTSGSERSAILARYSELGVSRIMANIRRAADDIEALDIFARDAREAGVL
jgi:alkanesulfonate monooxygenase SsuD/methylene tetrahydromethanopterin reductase-like flavin-dependent oxidoreductase (luciferase family)